MDSFKGSLKAVEACRIVADALSAALPDAQIVTKPMADGGKWEYHTRPRQKTGI